MPSNRPTNHPNEPPVKKISKENENENENCIRETQETKSKKSKIRANAEILEAIRVSQLGDIDIGALYIQYLTSVSACIIAIEIPHDLIFRLL